MEGAQLRQGHRTVTAHRHGHGAGFDDFRDRLLDVFERLGDIARAQFYIAVIDKAEPCDGIIITKWRLVAPDQA